MSKSQQAAIRTAIAEGRVEDARRLLTAVVTESRRAADPVRTVRALRSLAQVESHVGNTRAAQSLYVEAVAASREADDPQLVAHTIRHYGDLLRHAGQYGEAEACYLEALALYRDAPETSPGELANTVRPMALLMEALERVDSAYQYWLEARALYELASIDEGVAECASALDRLGLHPGEG